MKNGMPPPNPFGAPGAPMPQQPHQQPPFGAPQMGGAGQMGGPPPGMGGPPPGMGGPPGMAMGGGPPGGYFPHGGFLQVDGHLPR